MSTKWVAVIRTVLVGLLLLCGTVAGVVTLEGQPALAATVVGTIPASGANAVSSDGTHVWVSANNVVELDAATGVVVRSVPVAGSSISSDGSHVWLGQPAGVNGNGTISEIDASTGAAVRTIGAPYGLGAKPVAISSDGTHVWAVTDASSVGFPNGFGVTEIDASTGVQLGYISVGDGSSMQGVSSDGVHAWVTGTNANVVYEIGIPSSTSTLGTVIQTIPVGSGPVGISSDGSHVWVANTGDDTVTELDASTGAVVRTIGAGAFPDAISSDGTHVWVTNAHDNSVTEIDAATGAVVQTIGVGSVPTAVSSDGSRAWVVNVVGNSVSEIQIKPSPTAPSISNLPATGAIGGGFTAVVSTTGDGVQSVTSSTPMSCTASGLLVSYVGGGTCTLTAHVAAGPTYAAADGTPQSFVVAPCGTGTFSSTGGAPCTAAPPGFFVPTSAATSATPCALGTYQPAAGQSSCLAADPGSVVGTSGSTSESACSPGFYQPAAGQSSCLLADPGNFVGTSGSPAETVCVQGSYQPTSGQSACLSADPGSFVGTTGSLAESACAPGSYQPSGGQSACLPADPGSAVGATGSIAESACTPGTFSSSPGASTCTPAPPGTFVDQPGATGPTTCSAGTAQPNPGQTGCLVLPVVASISPSAGPLIGGSSVSITGSGFTGATAVAFGTTPAASFTVVSDSLIEVITPPGTGTSDITVRSPNGSSVVTSADQFTFVSCDSPAITSPNSDTVVVGVPTTFTVTTCSTGIPVLKVAHLVKGLTFVDNRDGTGTISGTPLAKASPGYTTTVTAHIAGQALTTKRVTFAVDQAPVFKSKPKAVITTGIAFDFAITTDYGSPVPALSSSPLPSGVTFSDNGNGTGDLSGTAGLSSGGVYAVTFTAENGIGAPVIQTFFLTINQAPAITTANSDTIAATLPMTPFTVSTSGFPIAKLKATGLPSGVKLTDNADGTATITGTPKLSSVGVHAGTIRGVSRSGSVMQTFTMIVTP
jgi:YVTN family beta-propeller protein